VYSLATLLFECLAGETPFAGPNAVAILLRQAAEAPPDVRSLPRAASVPAPLAGFLARCLAKAPQDRPENASAFCRELLNAARESGIDLATLPSLPTDLKLAKTLRLPVAPAEPVRSPSLFVEPASSARRSISDRKRGAVALLRRIGWVAGCFVLGALGALLIARQLGAFGASGAVDSHGSRGSAR
jgi:serine/threonine protein kinase